MILPEGTNPEKLTEEELVEKLVESGYTIGAAKYLAGKIKGSIKDDKVIQ